MLVKTDDTVVDVLDMKKVANATDPALWSALEVYFQ